MKNVTLFTAGLLTMTLAAAVLAAQPARTGAAPLTTRAHSGSLAAEWAKTTGPAWVGWAETATRRGAGGCCCQNGCIKVCRLEHGAGVDGSGQTLPSIQSGEIAILTRVEHGAAGHVAVVSADCEINTGNLPLVWLTGVSRSESAAFLEASESSGAMVGLALQEGSEAEASLIRVAREAQSGHRRGSGLFWLAQRASDKAVGVIGAAIENDPDTSVKKQAVFALSQMPTDEGVPKLIEVARANRNPAVRKQAFFWLGQSHDPRAFQFLEDTLTH